MFVHPFVMSLAGAHFSKLKVRSKRWWAFLMDMHFIGLALLIGTVRVLDLRMLGFARQLPIAPLHQLMPWAIVGFSINFVAGGLAFIGMPFFYTYDIAFWLEMLAISLAGLNVAVFYFTGTLSRVQHVGAGEDAPPLAKFIAASSLLLWFAVVILGRYIQLFEDSIPSGSN